MINAWSHFRHTWRTAPFVVTVALILLPLLVAVAVNVYVFGGVVRAGYTMNPLKRYANARSTIDQWTAAALRGDYATAERFMAGVDPLTMLTWRDTNSEFLGRGWIKTHQVVRLEPVGSTMAGVLRFTGSSRDVCLTVQVDAQGRLVPLNVLHFCGRGDG